MFGKQIFRWTQPHQEGAQESDAPDPKLPLTEHLRELRKRLIIILGAIGITFIPLWMFSGQLIEIFQRPLNPFLDQLQFDTLTDPFFTHLKAAFFGAVFLTFPVILSQIWLFALPALFPKERGAAWPMLLVSFPLFIGGALFCYFFVFPLAVEFLIQFDPRLQPSLRVGDYLSFVLRLLFVFGLVFEMPLLSLVCTRMGLITPELLTRNRRVAVVLVFIAAAVLTPPDVFTQLLLAGPLLILFEISVIVSRLARRSALPAEDST